MMQIQKASQKKKPLTGTVLASLEISVKKLAISLGGAPEPGAEDATWHVSEIRIDAMGALKREKPLRAGLHAQAGPSPSKWDRANRRALPRTGPGSPWKLKRRLLPLLDDEGKSGGLGPTLGRLQSHCRDLGSRVNDTKMADYLPSARTQAEECLLLTQKS
ncbi:hypothetical protein CB1_000128010 [Camelus ferus]|nr:hypothetical protein CB1_000128010 [Camelus ferus]